MILRGSLTLRRGGTEKFLDNYNEDTMLRLFARLLCHLLKATAGLKAIVAVRTLQR